MTILEQGSCEETKAIVHGGICALVTLAAVYNVAVLIVRGEREHVWNIGLYGWMAAIEGRRAVRHWRQRS